MNGLEIVLGFALGAADALCSAADVQLLSTVVSTFVLLTALSLGTRSHCDNTHSQDRVVHKLVCTCHLWSPYKLLPEHSSHRCVLATSIMDHMHYTPFDFNAVLRDCVRHAEALHSLLSTLDFYGYSARYIAVESTAALTDPKKTETI